MKHLYDNGELLIELAEMYLRSKRIQSDLDYYRDSYFKKCEEVRELESQSVKTAKAVEPERTF